MEGHDLQCGWHAFLWYKKRQQKQFYSYMIRRALLGTWTKTIQQIYQKIPVWVSPIEAFTQSNLMTKVKLLRYQDLLKNYCELRSNEELEIQNI